MNSKVWQAIMGTTEAELVKTYGARGPWGYRHAVAEELATRYEWHEQYLDEDNEIELNKFLVEHLLAAVPIENADDVRVVVYYNQNCNMAGHECGKEEMWEENPMSHDVTVVEGTEAQILESAQYFADLAGKSSVGIDLFYYRIARTLREA